MTTLITQDKKRAMYKELKDQILSWPSRELPNPYLKALLPNLELLESQIIWPFELLNLLLHATIILHHIHTQTRKEPIWLSNRLIAQ